MTRRFFIYDTISGVAQNEYPGGTPKYVRYPKKMTFEFQLNPDEEEMIYLPYLRIKYRERAHTIISE